MNTREFLFCAVLSFFSGTSCTYILNKTSIELDCKNICRGQFEFNAETNKCKCLETKHLDDIDAGLIRKNQLLAVGEIVKRETENSVTLTTPKLQEIETTTFRTDTTESDLNPEGFVGQAAPNRRRTQRPTPRPRPARTITLDQQRIITQQISDHLNRLNQISDQRLRELEIEAIRGNLRQLSNTVLAPQTRSRLRTVGDERRKIRPRILHSRIVGAPFPNFEEGSTEQAPKHKHFEIITQDPRLVDE